MIPSHIEVDGLDSEGCLAHLKHHIQLHWEFSVTYGSIGGSRNTNLTIIDYVDLLQKY